MIPYYCSVRRVEEEEDYNFLRAEMIELEIGEMGAIACVLKEWSKRVNPVVP